MAEKDKHDLHEHDAPIRDDLSGEDLSRGPTPETRHPAGHVTGRDFAEDDAVAGETGGFDDVSDTTQGPTPDPPGDAGDRRRRCGRRRARRRPEDSRGRGWQPGPRAHPARRSRPTRRQVGLDRPGVDHTETRSGFLQNG
jgi:hypothetical protein